MAFVSNDQSPEEEEKTNQPNGGQGPISPTGGGGGAVHLAPSSSVPTVGGGGTAGATGAASGPASAGGSFASLDKYLSANQGQAAPIAGQLTSSIGKQYNDLDTANNAAISNINSQVTNAPGYTASNPDVLAQEAANPVSFSNDQGNVKNFQNLLTNSYGGPASAESTSDFTGQQTAVNNAIAAGQAATTTEAGRENLLSQNEATPTTGVTALNSAILSQDPNALGSVESAYKPFNNLLTNLNTGATGVDTTIGKEQADAANSSKAANDAIASQIGGLNSGVASELTAAQTTAANQNAQLKSDVSTGNISQADLNMLGMTRDQWNSLSAAQKAAATSQTVSSNQGQYGANSGTTNIDMSQFLTQTDPTTLLNASNVATPQDYSQAQAFQTLLGGLNLNAPTATINPSTASAAGTAPTNFNTFDYQTALNTAQQAKTEEVAAAQAYVDALQSGADETHAQLAAANAQRNAAMEGAAMLLTGPVGVVGAALAGGANSAVNAIKNDISNPSLKNTGNILFSTAQGAYSAASNAVADAVQTVQQIFCFHPDTLVEMRSGMVLPICRIEVGDIVKGGKVLATTRAIGHDFYWYENVIVTGKHAVKENGVWIRVQDSKLGHALPGFVEVVCSLVTEEHRIYINGIEFADQHETDMYESLDMAESLQELNKNAKSLG